MTVVTRTTACAFLVLPALLLILGGRACFLDGWARDESLPIPNYLLLEEPAPPQAYARAAEALSRTNRASGANLITQAEAALYGGAPAASQISLIEQGLGDSPASARGWMLLAYTASHTDPVLAGRAAAIGYVMGPRDFWVAKIRARQAENLWPLLDSDTKAMAMTQVRLFWLDPMLHHQLLTFLSSPEGAKIVTQAFAGRSADLIAMNRWVLQSIRWRMPR